MEDEKMARWVWLRGNVRGDIPEVGGYVSAGPGRYLAHANPHGALSVVIPRTGQWLGIKPDEYLDLGPARDETLGQTMARIGLLFVACPRPDAPGWHEVRDREERGPVLAFGHGPKLLAQILKLVQERDGPPTAGPVGVFDDIDEAPCRLCEGEIQGGDRFVKDRCGEGIVHAGCQADVDRGVDPRDEYGVDLGSDGDLEDRLDAALDEAMAEDLADAPARVGLTPEERTELLAAVAKIEDGTDLADLGEQDHQRALAEAKADETVKPGTKASKALPVFARGSVEWGWQEGAARWKARPKPKARKPRRCVLCEPGVAHDDQKKHAIQPGDFFREGLAIVPDRKKRKDQPEGAACLPCVESMEQGRAPGAKGAA